jgi:hypothetical protein
MFVKIFFLNQKKNQINVLKWLSRTHPQVSAVMTYTKITAGIQAFQRCMACRAQTCATWLNSAISKCDATIFKIFSRFYNYAAHSKTFSFIQKKNQIFFQFFFHFFLMEKLLKILIWHLGVPKIVWKWPKWIISSCLLITNVVRRNCTLGLRGKVTRGYYGTPSGFWPKPGGARDCDGWN